MPVDPSVKILEMTRDISGKPHRLVEGADGFRFYLDPVFLYALEHADDPDLSAVLREMGVADTEIPVMFEMLAAAGLTGRSLP